MYSPVRVTTDRFRSEGAPTGTIGCVIDVYDDGAYEVEVAGPTGETVAQFVAREGELELAPQGT